MNKYTRRVEVSDSFRSTAGTVILIHTPRECAIRQAASSRTSVARRDLGVEQCFTPRSLRATLVRDDSGASRKRVRNTRATVILRYAEGSLANHGRRRDPSAYVRMTVAGEADADRTDSRDPCKRTKPGTGPRGR